MAIRLGIFKVFRMNCFQHFAACALLAWLACGKYGDPTAGILIAVGIGVAKEVCDLLRGIQRAQVAIRHRQYASLGSALLSGSFWSWKDSVLDLVYDILGSLVGFGTWAVGL